MAVLMFGPGEAGLTPPELPGLFIESLRPLIFKLAELLPALFYCIGFELEGRGF